MKYINSVVLAILAVVAVSCKEEVEKPKVTYDSSSKSKPYTKADSTQVAIADLPIQLEGTEYLIHPVGDLRIYEKGTKSRYGSSSVIDLSFTISNYGDNEITGYLQNLKFQRVSSDSIRPLTDKPVLIQTASYLKGIADKTKNRVMVYTLFDMDSNRDGKLDTSDIKSLYLSSVSGANFTKISVDLQELIDWSLIESQNRLYFRTVEDTNKNGQFDKNDVVHYNYIDLSRADWEVKSYEPVN
ncbi:EF-hand domain-containing protein [Flavobacterium faecale]|nr:EF-hand domain-containing protein [Flavobacterium faecale]